MKGILSERAGKVKKKGRFEISPFNYLIMTGKESMQSNYWQGLKVYDSVDSPPSSVISAKT
jgi:hypothetical protein